MVAQFFVIVFNMGAGFLTNTSSDGGLLARILSYISPLHYSCELLLRRILAGRKPEAVNEYILNYFGYTHGSA